MRHVFLGSFAFLLFTAVLSATAALQAAPADQQTQSHIRSAPVTGEQVFKAQCSRCHTPPMNISPRITGTVIMHMRVRARLSRQDEQLLLKYMAP
jgi:cytochrome c5